MKVACTVLEGESGGNPADLTQTVRLYLATHSPGIIMDGWEQLVTNISDLISISD